MFITKMIGSVCGIAVLYNLFYLDNSQLMNGLFTMLGGTSLYGIYTYIKHQRYLANDTTKANYENVGISLMTPTHPVAEPSAPLVPPEEVDNPEEYPYLYMQTK